MAAVELCFRVDGEYLTRLSRDRVIEERFDHGFNILFDGLVGISADQVLKILRGDAKLIGVNDLDMVDDDDTDYKAQLDYFYAGVWVTSGGRYLRPYAVVTSWGSEDMAHSDKITPDSDNCNRKSGTFASVMGEMAGRDLFYADDMQRDVVKYLRYKPNNPDIAQGRDGTVAILFKEVKNFPHLLRRPHHEAQAALDEFLSESGRGLEIRGYVQTFPPMERELRSNVVPIKIPDMDEGRLDRVNRVLENMRSKSVEKYREEIIAQAGDNWIDMEYKGKTIRVPEAPFQQWCLWRTDGAHLALPWNKVSPSGMKMGGDDPYHTDFLIGAGFEPRAMLDDEELERAFYDLRYKVQHEKMDFKCAVLSGRGYQQGTVIHVVTGDETIPDDAIVIVKNAAAKHLDQVLRARAVIVERGGAMAHLVTVARETEALIVRVKDAMKIYPNGSSVTVNANIGTVTLHEGDMKMIWDQY